MRLAPDKPKDWRPDLGFEVRARCDSALDDRARDALTSRFIEEAIEGNDLVCGGAVFGHGEHATELHVVVSAMSEGGSCTARDRLQVETWLRSEPGFVQVHVGRLCSTETDGFPRDEPALPPVMGEDARERALWLRTEAIAEFRKAAAVLGRPEIRDAEQHLLRAIQLVHAGYDELCRALFRKLELDLPGESFDESRSTLFSFFSFDLDQAVHPKRLRGWRRTPLKDALHDVTFGIDNFDNVIDLPDLHDLERHIVGASRTAIDELWKLVMASPRSTLAKRLERAAVGHRKRRADQERERARPRKRTKRGSK